MTVDLVRLWNFFWLDVLNRKQWFVVHLISCMFLSICVSVSQLVHSCLVWSFQCFFRFFFCSSSIFSLFPIWLVVFCLFFTISCLSLSLSLYFLFLLLFISDVSASKISRMFLSFHLLSSSDLLCKRYLYFLCFYTNC